MLTLTTVLFKDNSHNIHHHKKNRPARKSPYLSIDKPINLRQTSILYKMTKCD